MHLKTLLLLSVFIATSVGFYNLGDPHANAQMMNANLNEFVRKGDSKEAMKLFSKNFQYEDCQGKKYGASDYVRMAIQSSSYASSLLTVRSDKDHIIYKVGFGQKQKEFMITKHVKGFGPEKYLLEKCQDLIC